MANTFVSYSRRSEPTAKALVADLEALGHTVWFDQDLSGGQAWWDQILATIRGCDVFVFVLDPDSLASTACQREYGYAVAVMKPILPILVSGDISINLLPPALSRIQLVDYRAQDRTAAIRLARAVAQMPPSGPLPEPLPDPPAVPLSYLGTLAAQVDGTSLLSYEHQCALLLDLKAQLRDPSTASDARLLLDRLLKRRDLLATVADEIAALVASGPAASAPRAAPHPTAAVTVADGAPPPSPWAHHQVSMRERIGCAIAGAVVFVVMGAVASGTYSEFEPAILVYAAIGGAIPGAIAGPRRTYLLAAFVGAVLGAALLLLVDPKAPDAILAAIILAAPIGATLASILAITLRRR